MTRPAALVARPTFLRVGALAGFPAVLTLEAGAEGWERFTSTSTPPDRQRVLDALVPAFSAELIATPAAAARLAHWIALGGPIPSRRVLDRALNILGLDRVRRSLVDAVRRMPPCVAHHLLHHVWILGCQRGVGGWTWQAPPTPAGPLTLIVLDGKPELGELVPLFAHEVAHAWLLAVAPVDQVPTLRERVRAAALPRRLAREWGRADLLATWSAADLAAEVRSDRQAAALARSWGFGGPVADPEFCADATRWAAMRRP